MQWRDAFAACRLDLKWLNWEENPRLWCASSIWMSTSPASAGGPPENMKELKVSHIETCLFCGDTPTHACYFQRAIKSRDMRNLLFTYFLLKEEIMKESTLSISFARNRCLTIKQWVKKQMVKILAHYLWFICHLHFNEWKNYLTPSQNMT